MSPRLQGQPLCVNISPNAVAAWKHMGPIGDPCPDSAFAPVSALRNAAMRLFSHSMLTVGCNKGQGHDGTHGAPFDSNNCGQIL